MGKQISTFGNIEFEENKLYRHKSLNFKKDINIEKVLVSSKILVERTISTLLITYTMIVKLSRYI